MINIVFRADAATEIGKGHVMRCLTLATELKAQGATISFICREFSGHLIKEITAQGFKVFSLAQGENTLVLSNEKTWLSVTQNQDALACIDVLPANIDWLIVDHYAIDTQWHQQLKPHVNKIFVIDDLANRQHDCDALLDQTLLRTPADYQKLTPSHCQQFLGTDFTLIRQEFSLLREKALIKRSNSSKEISHPHVLISLGGYDHHNVSQTAIDAMVLITRILPTLSATIVVSSQSSHLKTLSDSVQAQNNLTLLTDCNNMAELMLKADIAIGASGSSAWERCSLGLPTLSITLADNQQFIANRLAEVGAHHNLGYYQNISAQTIKQACLALINSADDYQLMSKKAFSLIDTKGAMRIAKHLMAMPVTLKAIAANDRDIIFGWQSMPEIRRYARNTNTINYKEHCSWFEHLIADNTKSAFLIMLTDRKNNQGEIPVGMLRLEPKSSNTSNNIHSNKQNELSILISPEHQGKKIALNAINAIPLHLRNKDIYAYVKRENIASQRLFCQAGFERLSDEQFILKALTHHREHNEP